MVQLGLLLSKRQLSLTTLFFVSIFGIVVSSSMYVVTEIARSQAANDPSRPLDTLSPARLNKELARIAEMIKDIGK